MCGVDINGFDINGSHCITLSSLFVLIFFACSQPLGRLGANVVGLDASEENIKIAQAHLIHDPQIRDKVKYIHSTVEDIAEQQAGKFDAVVASEVLEHVADAQTFVSSACKLIRVK